MVRDVMVWGASCEFPYVQEDFSKNHAKSHQIDGNPSIPSESPNESLELVTFRDIVVGDEPLPPILVGYSP